MLQQFTQRGAILLLALSMFLTFVTLFQPYGFYDAIATPFCSLGEPFSWSPILVPPAALEPSKNGSRSWSINYSRPITNWCSTPDSWSSSPRDGNGSAWHASCIDSVTQTIFSKTLTTQSAIILLNRDLKQVTTLLDRLAQLSHNALSEMQILISKLAPENLAGDGFIASLREHFTERKQLNDLSVQFEVYGSLPMNASEEQNLFRIVQEALNNVVKHSGDGQVSVRLCLEGQPWLQIEDHGVGFDPQQVRPGGRMGLANMQERALEIGWTLQLASSPGNGTRITVLKASGG